MTRSTAAIGDGGHDPDAGLRALDVDAAAGEAGDGHLDVRQARQAFAGVPQREAAGEARGREQQARDELARGGGVDRQLAALDRARAVHGERHRAAAVVADVDPEAAQGVDRRAHRSSAGLRVAVDADRPEGERRDRGKEAHDRAGQAAVDRDPAEQLAGGDRRSGP